MLLFDMSYNTITFIGVIIPFIGTVLGAGLVFFLKNNFNERMQSCLGGFAAGVMIAASVWSLLIPSIEMASGGHLPVWLPAVCGFIVGIAFLALIDFFELSRICERHKGVAPIKDSFMSVLAIVLHNIPEGMAVGVVFAGLLDGADILPAEALALSIGIAVQNLPEGAIISAPIGALGVSKGKSFLLGVLSGVVEPISAIITIWLTSLVLPVLPYILSFAAGAMMYVVVTDLIPSSVKHRFLGVLGVTLGFSLMLILDVALG